MNTHDDKDMSLFGAGFILIGAFIAGLIGLVRDTKPSEAQTPKPKRSFLETEKPGTGVTHNVM